MIPSYSGNYNRILIVTSNELWSGSFGDSIREYLAAGIDGIRPMEPMFTLDQISEDLFTGKEKRGRNIIYFDSKAYANSFDVESDKFAKPQNFFHIKSNSKNGLIKEFKRNVDSIVRVVHNFEIAEIQRRLEEGKLHQCDFLESEYGVSLKLPIDYKQVFYDSNLAWFKKEIASGNSNILLYEIPFSKLDNESNLDNVLSKLMQSKDSIVSKYIHSSETGSYMKVDGDYVTFHKKLILDAHDVLELRGSWDMNNSFMDGPFICYVIKDIKNKRYLFIEGFTYNPSMSKRDVLFEIEAIIKTVHFTN
ncbi:MAG: DUF4837 family protein [Flavobacteriaceae bacterium]|nr:DUF4837 family protein [Flavobacteriaceae bacterium]